MKNKKIFWIIIAVLVLSLLTTLGIILLKKNNLKVEEYSKYSMILSIDSIKNGKKENILLNVMDDGKAIKILSTNSLDTYIIGDYMYYLKDRTFYRCKLNSSYRDIYAFVASLKYDYVDSTGDYSNYQRSLNSSDVNNILEMLFFGMKTKKSTLLNISIKDEKLASVNFTLGDIGSYDSVNVDIKYVSLEDDYEIDTSRIYGSSSLSMGGVTYKQEETKENPYMIFEN